MKIIEVNFTCINSQHCLKKGGTGMKVEEKPRNAFFSINDIVEKESKTT
jgi:hypothetical protein